MELCRARSRAGGVGPSQAIDKSARDCLAVDLLAPGLSAELPPPLLGLVQRISLLRVELAAATARPLVDVAELQLLIYPAGGHYRRHVDAGKASQRRAVRRSISLLVYLTEAGWDAAEDGGQLRVFADGGIDAPPSPTEPSDRDQAGASATFDVAPTAGTLVLFDSLSVPHSVLPTRRPRLALAGWLCEQ